jgi:hypothetical protein
VCVEPPHALPLTTAFAGLVAGDTIGNLTPLGPVLGEPTKAAYVRGPIPAVAALTALAIETVLYALSAAAMIAAGMLALLFAFELTDTMRRVGQTAILGVLLLFAIALWMLWTRPALLSRWLPLLSREGSRLHASAERIRALEHQVYTFAARRPAALVSALACEAAFHALGVVEAYITLAVMTGTPPALLTAFILETAQRLMAILFKLVPFQMGVGEVGTAAVTAALGLGTTVGVTIAIIRKARMAAWAGVGAVLLVLRGRSLFPASE